MFEPETVEMAAEIVRSSERLRIVGSNTKRDFGCPLSEECVDVSTKRLSGIIEWSPDDLVVVVKGGTLISELQAELATRNQCLPIPPYENGLDTLTAGLPGTVGGLVSANLPTRWDNITRGVRYWVLGMTIVRADGTIAKAGSKAVKNVAGYDSQKLFIGAWGTLGILAEVAFRVAPLRACDEPPCIAAWDGAPPLLIARGPNAEMDEYASGFENRLLDATTGTVWARTDKAVAPPDNGWIYYAGLQQRNFPHLGQNQDLMASVKRKLDPTGKFNPGKMGAF